MKKIVFICPEYRGHLNPSASLAQELRSRGFRILFTGRMDGEACIREQGFDYLSFGIERFPLGYVPSVAARIGKMQGKKALRETVRSYLEAVKFYFEELPAILQREKPDLLIIDQTLRAVSSIAEKQKIPFVTICNALSISETPGIPPFFANWEYSDTWGQKLKNRIAFWIYKRSVRPILKEINRWRKNNGLDEFENLDQAGKGGICISQISEEIDFPQSPVSNFFRTGPFFGEDRREEPVGEVNKLKNEDFIYASLGTVQNRIETVYKDIAVAAEKIGIKLVIGLGGGPDLNPDTLSGNPVVLKYAPQLYLLKHAKVVITHAGLNTALEALASGTPMVAIPITNDQPGVANRLKFHKCAEVVPLKKATAETIERALKKVLENPEYRNNCKKKMNLISQKPGRVAASDIIEDYLKSAPIPH